jgi:hypothetical protein
LPLRVAVADRHFALGPARVVVAGLAQASGAPSRLCPALEVSSQTDSRATRALERAFHAPARLARPVGAAELERVEASSGASRKSGGEPREARATPRLSPRGASFRGSRSTARVRKDHRATRAPTLRLRQRRDPWNLPPGANP